MCDSICNYSIDIIEIISIVVGSILLIIMLISVIMICRSNGKRKTQAVAKDASVSGVAITMDKDNNSANVSLLSDIYTAPPVGTTVPTPVGM